MTFDWIEDISKIHNSPELTIKIYSAWSTALIMTRFGRLEYWFEEFEHDGNPFRMESWFLNGFSHRLDGPAISISYKSIISIAWSVCGKTLPGFFDISEEGMLRYLKENPSLKGYLLLIMEAHGYATAKTLRGAQALAE